MGACAVSGSYRKALKVFLISEMIIVATSHVSGKEIVAFTIAPSITEPKNTSAILS